MSAIDENREQLEQRLRTLVGEYLRECDPSSWPAPIDGIPAQQQRYWAKRHAQELLKEMNALQALLRSTPRIDGRDDNSEGAQLIARAKRQAAELRARAGLVPKGVQ